LLEKYNKVIVMAKYKSKDLLIKTKDELVDRIQFLRKEQFNLRFQVVNGQIENPLRFRLIRREIAAIKTILNNNLMKVK
tara:strand:- start:21 stop:257 length:237 start_codon:yes stop_codon:yes gene_type:complete